MLPLKLVRDRIANSFITNSALRKQPVGSVAIATLFMKNLDLTVFSNATSQAEYLEALDEYTIRLESLLPSRSWGMARKVLNIFIFQATQDVILSKAYKLKHIIPYLEVVLDNPNAKRLIKKAATLGVKLEWKNINDLRKVDSDALQAFAEELAGREYKCPRCYLDYYFWRAD